MSILLAWVFILTGLAFGYVIGSMFPAAGLRIRMINLERKIEAHIKDELDRGRIMTQNEKERIELQFREFFKKL